MNDRPYATDVRKDDLLVLNRGSNPATREYALVVALTEEGSTLTVQVVRVISVGSTKAEVCKNGNKIPASRDALARPTVAEWNRIGARL